MTLYLIYNLINTRNTVKIIHIHICIYQYYTYYSVSVNVLSGFCMYIIVKIYLTTYIAHASL